MVHISTYREAVRGGARAMAHEVSLLPRRWGFRRSVIRRDVLGGPQHARRPAQPTKGPQVLRIVDKHGSISFAGTGYRVGNRFIGTTVDVRLVADTVQISLDGALLRTHRARHDKTKEFGALAQPNGKPRKAVASET